MFELLLILLIGSFLIYVALRTNQKECPPNNIQYRYVPKTFSDEMLNPVKPSQLFSSMFNEPNVFLGMDKTQPSLPTYTNVSQAQTFQPITGVPIYSTK